MRREVVRLSKTLASRISSRLRGRHPKAGKFLNSGSVLFHA